MPAVNVAILIHTNACLAMTCRTKLEKNAVDRSTSCCGQSCTVVHGQGVRVDGYRLHVVVQTWSDSCCKFFGQTDKSAVAGGFTSCFLAEAQRTQRLMTCWSDYNRELSMFATKVAPTNTCKSLCVLSASARVNIISLFYMPGLEWADKNHGRSLNWYDTGCQIKSWLLQIITVLSANNAKNTKKEKTK